MSILNIVEMLCSAITGLERQYILPCCQLSLNTQLRLHG
jgi:hypothetical protein